MNIYAAGKLFVLLITSSFLFSFPATCEALGQQQQQHEARRYVTNLASGTRHEVTRPGFYKLGNGDRSRIGPKKTEKSPTDLAKAKNKKATARPSAVAGKKRSTTMGVAPSVKPGRRVSRTKTKSALVGQPIPTRPSSTGSVRRSSSIGRSSMPRTNYFAPPKSSSLRASGPLRTSRPVRIISPQRNPIGYPMPAVSSCLPGG